MKYSEKLKNPKWQRKRLEILNRDNFTCLLCGDTETELQIHHLKYTGYNPEDAPNEDLQTLCKVCHSIKTKHKESEHGKFISAIKTKYLLTIQFEDNGIGIFYYDSENYEHCCSFMENSEAYFKINEFVNKCWTNKK